MLPEFHESDHSVSVIIPVFNGEKYLGAAIESALNQTVKPLEIIIVDDGSTDSTLQIALSYAPVVRYVRQEHAGIGAARNRGFLESHGVLIAFLDADDLWEPDKLLLQATALAATQSPCLIFGLVRQFVSPEITEELQVKLGSNFPKEIAGKHAGCMLVHREVFDSVGPFSEQLRNGEFIDWYSRARQQGVSETIIDKVLMHRRIHGNNYGIREKLTQKDYLHVVKQALERRRNSGNISGDSSSD